MPLLFVLDLLALRAYRQAYDPILLRMLLPWSMIGVLIGFLLFKFLNAHIVEGVVGVFALGFVAQRVLFPPSPQGVLLPRWIGATLTAISGFTSFIAHAGSPALNAYVLPMRLAPLTYAATMAVLFFWVNLAKWVPYAYLGLFDVRGLVTAVILMPVTPIGIWIGVHLARHMSPKLFYACIQVGMALTGFKLVFDGFVRGG
jgi:uncharacterized membrane protein YfcA